MMAEQTGKMEYSLTALLHGFAEMNDGRERMVTGLSVDSRSIQQGDLFIACDGSHVQGYEYIEQAIQSGAVAVVLDSNNNINKVARLDAVPVIAVDDLQNKLGLIADRFYDHPSQKMLVIGITGTNGKTSCAHFISQVLHSKSEPCGMIGTLGNGLYDDIKPGTHTTPLAIPLHGLISDLYDAGAKRLVMEVSSHGLEQNRVGGVQFDLALFTNLSRDHLDYHGDMESYANAKRMLFQIEGLQYAVINTDDAFGQSLLKEISDVVSVVAYSLSGVAQQGVSTICVTQITLDKNGIVMQVDTPWGSGELRSSLLGRFNAENLLASMACLLVMGLQLEDVLERLAQIETVPGRMERIEGTNGPTVIVDYAHTPDALEHVLNAAREHCAGKLWCVFGCGGDRDQGKRALMGEVAARLSDYVIVTDDNPRHEDPKKIVNGILSGMNKREHVLVEHDRAMAIRNAIEKADKNDLVLIAGKGHEDYQLIRDEKRPFSDREYVKVLLDKMA